MKEKSLASVRRHLKGVFVLMTQCLEGTMSRRESVQTSKAKFYASLILSVWGESFLANLGDIWQINYSPQFNGHNTQCLEGNFSYAEQLEDCSSMFQHQSQVIHGDNSRNKLHTSASTSSSHKDYYLKQNHIQDS